MVLIGKIRGMRMRDGKSIREISRLTSPPRNSIKKWRNVPQGATPKYRRRDVSTKLAPFIATLTQALEVDARRAKHERRSARALHVQLASQGYDGGYTRLTDFVRQWRDKQGKFISARAFMPLAFELGEAFQFDWSEEGLVVGGIYYRMQVSHLKLCASRAFWLVAYPSQGHAMLFDARTRSFAAMGGQANTVVSLPVATIFGLVGTSTTGFLSMNLLAAADAPLSQRALAFLAVLALTLSITVYTIVKSKRLSNFLNAVSDERLSAWTKLKSFFAVWRWRQ